MKKTFHGFPRSSNGRMPLAASFNQLVRVWAGEGLRSFADPSPFRTDRPEHWVQRDSPANHNIVAYIDTGIPLEPTYIERLEAMETAAGLSPLPLVPSRPAKAEPYGQLALTQARMREVEALLSESKREHAALKEQYAALRSVTAAASIIERIVEFDQPLPTAIRAVAAVLLPDAPVHVIPKPTVVL